MKQVLVYCDVKYSDFVYSPSCWQEREVEWDQIKSSLDNPVQKDADMNIFLPSACLSFISSTEIYSREKNNTHAKIKVESRDVLLESVEMVCKHYHLMSAKTTSSNTLLRFSFNGKIYPLECSLTLEGPKVLGIIARTLQKNKLLYYPEEIAIYGHNDDLSLQSKGFSEHDCIPVILSGVTREREKLLQLEQKDGYLYYDVTLKTQKDMDLFIRNAQKDAFFFLNRLVIRFGSLSNDTAGYLITDFFSLLHEVFLPHLEVLSLIYLSIDASDNWIDCFFVNPCVALKDIVVYIPCAPALILDARWNSSRKMRRIIHSVDSTNFSDSTSVSSSILLSDSVGDAASKSISGTFSDLISATTSNTASDTVSDTASSDTASIESSGTSSVTTSDVASIESSDTASIESSDTTSVTTSDVASIKSSDALSFSSSDSSSNSESSLSSSSAKAQPMQNGNTSSTSKLKTSGETTLAKMSVLASKAENSTSIKKKNANPITTMTTSTVINGVSYNISVEANAETKQTTYKWKRVFGKRSFSVIESQNSSIIRVFANNVWYLIPVSKVNKKQTLYSAVVRGLGMYGIVASHSSISLQNQKGKEINKNTFVTVANTNDKYTCTIRSKKYKANNSEMTLDMRENADKVILNYYTSMFVNKVIHVVGRIL